MNANYCNQKPAVNITIEDMPLNSPSIPLRLLNDTEDLSHLLDEVDTGSIDCRTCITRGNEV